MNDTPDAPQSPAPGPRFEFGASENAVIERTARWVGLWGWIAVAAGILLLVGGLMTLDEGGVAQLVLGAVYILIGLYFRGAGKSLGRVVETTGNDVSHLMDALDRLTAAFRVQVILVVVGVILAVVAALFFSGGGGATP